MKIVIDIPEELYNNIISTWGNIHPQITEILKNAEKQTNTAEWNEMLEDIKVEINQLSIECNSLQSPDAKYIYQKAIKHSIEIIDKHISRKESEDET